MTAASPTPAEESFAADPLGREVLREDVVEKTATAILNSIQAQFGQQVTRAEWREVVSRVKTDINPELEVPVPSWEQEETT